MCQWTSLCLYLCHHVDLMLSLLLLTALVGLWGSYLASPLLLHRKQLSYFLNIGYVDLVFPQRSSLTGTHVSLLFFGKACVRLWVVGLLFPRLTTPRLMGSLSATIGRWNRSCVAILVPNKSSGVFCFLSVSLLWIAQCKILISKFLLLLFMVLHL